MNTAKIAREMASLPPEVRQEIIAFMTFVKAQYSTAKAKTRKQTKLKNEPFVGMWRTRKDMCDSTAWVRKIRQHQWKQEQ